MCDGLGSAVRQFRGRRRVQQLWRRELRVGQLRDGSVPWRIAADNEIQPDVRCRLRRSVLGRMAEQSSGRMRSVRQLGRLCGRPVLSPTVLGLSVQQLLWDVGRSVFRLRFVWFLRHGHVAGRLQQLRRPRRLGIGWRSDERGRHGSTWSAVTRRGYAEACSPGDGSAAARARQPDATCRAAAVPEHSRPGNAARTLDWRSSSRRHDTHPKTLDVIGQLCVVCVAAIPVPHAGDRKRRRRGAILAGRDCSLDAIRMRS